VPFLKWLQLISQSKISEVQGHFALWSIYEAHPQRLSQLQQVPYITQLRIILCLPIPSHISKARIFSFLLIFEAPNYTQVSSNKVAEKTMTKYHLNLLIPSTTHSVRGLMNPMSGTELHKLIKSLSQYDCLLWPHHSVFFLKWCHELRATLNEGPVK
jgi:hypothetical protein